MADLNQSTSTPRRRIVDKHSDKMPIISTGLSNKLSNVQPRKLFLCILCKQNLGDNVKAEQLCNNCSVKLKSISIIALDSSPSCSTVNSDHKEILPVNSKRTLLPSPVNTNNGNSPQQNNLEHFVSLSSDNTDAEVHSPISTPQMPEKLKWKSSIREQLSSRSKSSPYLRRPSPNANVDDTLTRQIWDLFCKNRQRNEVYNMKMALRDKLHEILCQRFPTCGLYVVGSSMTGLGVMSSDIDMCLMLTDSEVDQHRVAIQILHIVKNLFLKHKFLFNIQVIPANVPILKFVDSVSDIEVDLNINNSIGIRNTQLLSSYARMDKRFPPLVVLVKMWARFHEINDAKHNTLSSYSIVLMVIHYLQYRCQPPVLPCLQRLQPDKFRPESDVRNLKLHEDLPSFVSENNQNYGDLFIGFLKYFSNEFNYQNSVMSVRLGTIISRENVMYNSSPNNKKAHWKFICIEEPFDLTNTARSVFNDKAFLYIQDVFEKSWNLLRRSLDLKSILY